MQTLPREGVTPYPFFNEVCMPIVGPQGFGWCTHSNRQFKDGKHVVSKMHPRNGMWKEDLCQTQFPLGSVALMCYWCIINLGTLPPESPWLEWNVWIWSIYPPPHKLSHVSFEFWEVSWQNQMPYTPIFMHVYPMVSTNLLVIGVVLSWAGNFDI